MQGDLPFVLIVEDHPLVADSLVSCVRACNAYIRIDTVESIHAALAILAERPTPLLIVTDLTLSDSNGMDTLRRLRGAAPKSPILVFTALDDPRLRAEARQFDVFAYLVKSTSIEALRDAICTVISGDSVDEHCVVPEHATALNRLLTQKQLAVLEELVAGRSNKEIATRMNISAQTVGSHMKEILGRLAVRNRTEAVVRYFQLIKQPPNERRGQ